MSRYSWILLAFLAFACSSPPPAQSSDEHDPHEGSIAEDVDCGNCHTPDGWRISGSSGEAGGFDHDATGFPLRGRHESVGCVDCHQPNQEVRRDCVSCHEDIHQSRLGTRCDECHSPRGFQLTDVFEIHRRTLLPLSGMHALADCTECHLRQGESFVRNAPSDCFACHADDYMRPDVHPSHLGDADSPAFPRDCAQCHRPLGWTPALILLDALPRTDMLTANIDHDLVFPITFGPHRGAECASCHSVPAAPRIVQCTGCHEHNAVAVRLAHPNLAIHTDGPGCLACHPGGSVQ